jgi:hypothetical protein
MSQPPVINPYGPAPEAGLGPAWAGPSAGRGRRVSAVLVPLLLLCTLTALVVVFLTGMVTVGKPSMTAITLAPKIDETQRPTSAATEFSSDAPAVYCCATVRAFSTTKLEARWFDSSGQVARYRSTFGAMSGTAGAKFLPSRGRVAFKLERPKRGWSLGPYTVRLLLDNAQAGEADFTVSKARVEGTSGTRYEDPSGGFSILVPEGWKAADKSSLEGALAGFMGQMGPYPPRFAVSLTDFTSVETGYLNQVMKQEGANSNELFQQYSIGDLAGARRTFDWELDAGNNQRYRLRSIQVVVQVDNRVYGIDCHSLAIDFSQNEPTFNAVINSFR